MLFDFFLSKLESLTLHIANNEKGCHQLAFGFVAFAILKLQPGCGQGPVRELFPSPMIFCETLRPQPEVLRTPQNPRGSKSLVSAGSRLGFLCQSLRYHTFIEDTDVEKTPCLRLGADAALVFLGFETSNSMCPIPSLQT